MAKLERIYTVPLGDAYDAVRSKRVPRAVKILRTFIARHMKADGERILLSEGLNTYLWARSIQKPPRRVKVRLIKDEGEIRAYLADEKIEAPKKGEKKDEKAEGKKEEKKPEAKAEPKKEAKGEAQNPKPETGSRKPDAGNRIPENAPREQMAKKESR